MCGGRKSEAQLRIKAMGEGGLKAADRVGGKQKEKKTVFDIANDQRGWRGNHVITSFFPLKFPGILFSVCPSQRQSDVADPNDWDIIGRESKGRLG